METTTVIPVGEPFELSGRIVGLERETGRAVLVARSTWSKPWRWHRIIVDEPGQLINVTPGPGGQNQPADL
jgi:hypothetical protein